MIPAIVKSCRAWIPLWIFCLLLSTGTVLAQDEVSIGTFFGVGARAMGMGGAFLAVADDYTALYWNPAGLAQIRRIEIYSGLSHERYENDATFQSFNTKDSKSSLHLSTIGFAYPVPTEQGSFVLSAGYNRLGSFDGILALTSRRSSEQVNAWETESGGLGTWSFGGAVDVSPSLSLGASLDIWDGDDDYSWDYDVTDSQDPFGGYRYYDTIESDYSGVGLKIGGLLRVNRKMNLGFTITSPVILTIDEFWTQQTDTLNASYYDEGQFKYELKTPYRIGFGGAVRLEHLRIAADVEYVDWTQTEYESPQWLSADNWIFPQSYREVYTAHLGAEYDIPRSDVTLRAGYMHDPLPYESDQIQGERDYITIGAGFIVDNMVKIDLAIAHGMWERNDGSLLEEITADRFFLSLAYRF